MRDPIIASLLFCNYSLMAAGIQSDTTKLGKPAVISTPGKGKAVVPQKDDKNDKNWFEKNVTIGQSMATSDQQALPAQFTITAPQHKSASYAVNLGVNINLHSFGKYLTTKFTREFHRNTLTDSVQNNFQVGVKGTFGLNPKNDDKGTHLNIIIDPQWIVDRAKMENSLASNLLFTWNTDGSSLNWNKHNFVFDKSGAFIPAILAETQVQQVFAEDTTAAHGFKLRPVIIGNLSYIFLKKGNEIDPVVRLLTSYTQRVCAVNKTDDGEKWTHLFRAEADYFILQRPLKLSVGASFLNGADIFSGQKQQQYFLVSLTLYAGK